MRGAFGIDHAFMAFNVTTSREQKPRTGIAMGGLGTGCFELRQDGTTANWSIFNNEPLGTGAPFPFLTHPLLFFTLRLQEEGGNPRLRLLQIEESHDSAAIQHHEFQYIFPWLAGMDRIDYSATFPFVDMRFEQSEMPLEVELSAWSPFIPHNVKDSALPVAFFNLKIRSTADVPLFVSPTATLRNGAGYDTQFKKYTSRVLRNDAYVGFESGVAEMDAAASSNGTLAMASVDPESHYYLGWEHQHPYYERFLAERSLPDFDDTESRNKKDKETGKYAALARCFSSINRTVRLEPGKEITHRFVMAWHFPNLYAQPVEDQSGNLAGYLEEEDEGDGSTDSTAKPIEGHYYSNFFDSASDAVDYAIKEADRLEKQTRDFHDAYYSATIDPWLLDQVNSNLNTFRTSSWLTKAGDFGILEGLSPVKSFAGLATTDVAMYGNVSTSALFPELDKTIAREHIRLQNENGSVVHSIRKNFSVAHPREASGKRVDMPGQFAYMTLRAWLWSNDTEFLKEVWPDVKRALDYILRERDPNNDLLPDMEGVMCSYDNFPMYGVAPYVASQWLAGAAAAVAAAETLGDQEAAARYRESLEKGAARLEEACWNGKYFSLFHDQASEHGRDEGCLTDQLLGQWCTHLAGLPRIVDAEKTRSALSAIMEMNYRPEQGLRNCQWPGDRFLHPVEEKCWVDQANTCWTGVELAFASFLIYEGMVEEGMRVVKNVDDRYRKYGIYFDHQEFGGHYFRPMAAWGILSALLGLEAHAGTLRMAPKIATTPLRLLYSLPGGYGFYTEEENRIAIRPSTGELRFSRLELTPRVDLSAELKGSLGGQPLEGCELVREGNRVILNCSDAMILDPENALEIRGS